MDYYEGQTLAEYLAAHGPRVPWKIAVAIMSPILYALDQVHAEDVLHRDIKPTNIYLTGDMRPILLDFGTARVALADETKTLTAYHSPGFTPPEQLMQSRQGPWTDVYGAAATLYTLITGAPPADVLVPGSEVVPANRLVPELPQEISAAISRSLSRDWQSRPSSAGEFARALSSAPAIVRPIAAAIDDDATYRDPDLTIVADATRTAVADADETNVVDDDATAIAPATLARRQPSEMSPTPASPAPRRRSVSWIATGAGAVVLAAGALWASSRGKTPTDGTQPLRQVDRTANPESATIARTETTDPAGNLGGKTPDAEQAGVDPPPRGGEVDRGTGTQKQTDDSQGGSRKTTTGETAAVDPPPKPRATGLAVLVYGDDPAPAETAIRSTLSPAAGITLMDGQSLAIVRGSADPSRGGGIGGFASEARNAGIEYMVVGELTTSASSQIAGRFAGEASLSVTMYRLSDGTTLGSETFRVGSGAVKATTGMSETSARSQAAERAARMASQAVQRWLAAAAG
jgi:Protein kinase domain